MGFFRILSLLTCRRERGGDQSRLVQVGAVMSLLVVALKVVFSLLLIIMMLSIWALVQGKRPHPWLLWVKGALIPVAIIVGLVHIVGITYLVLRARARARETGVSNARALWESVKGFLRLMFFEWSILNATSLFLSLSSIGLTDLGYDFHVAFIVTVSTGLIHYVIFVRFYLARKPFVLWRARDLAFVMFPLLLCSVIAFGIVLGVYFNTTVGETIADYWIPLAGGLAFLFIVLPFIVYRCVLLPYQAKASVTRRVPLGPPRTPMEAAIRRHCKAEKVSREEIESLLLVGMDLDSIDGLEYSPRLKRLYLSANGISDLRPICVLPALEALHVDDNRISSWESLLPLRDIHTLKKINIAQNPLCQESSFAIAKVAVLLPQLDSINQVAITPAIRSKAEREYTLWSSQLLCQVARSAYLATPPSTDMLDTWILRGLPLHRREFGTGLAQRVLATSAQQDARVRERRMSQSRIPPITAVPVYLRDALPVTQRARRYLTGDRLPTDMPTASPSTWSMPDHSDSMEEHPVYTCEDAWSTTTLHLPASSVVAMRPVTIDEVTTASEITQPHRARQPRRSAEPHRALPALHSDAIGIEMVDIQRVNDCDNADSSRGSGRDMSRASGEHIAIAIDSGD